MRFALIDQAKEQFPVQRLCSVLGVSQSGYFAWKDRPACRRQRDDLVLLAHARSAFALSNGTYGSPRMTRELQERTADWGFAIGRRRTARLMRENDLKARQKRRFKRTTDSEHSWPVAPNIIDQDFAADGPNQKWGVDISYVWTREGWLYLAVVLDLFSRRVVGWAVGEPGGTVLLNGDTYVRLGPLRMGRRDPGNGRLSEIVIKPDDEEQHRSEEPIGSFDQYILCTSQVPTRLITAYTTTPYHVFGSYGSFTLRIGHRSPVLARLFQTTSQYEAVFITAENPFSQTATDAENMERLEDLRRELSALSQSVFEGEGQGLDPAWPAEKSYLALGIPPHVARALGERYQQNAIVWVGEDAIPRLILLR